jgi:exopolyphosphatase/guanosine-5'-triphosphate,3'-diphosphate pyrophosphatase
VATSATREAENRSDFLRLLERDAQIDVHIVSGREEARLIYLGVSSGMHLGNKKALFIDIGGGSTELIVGDQLGYDYLDSLKLGAIRLTSLFFLPDQSGPISTERYALIQQYVRNTAVRSVQAISKYSFDFAIGSSGTIENLADIAALMFLKRRRLREDVFQYDQLRRVVEMLSALPLEERRQVPGINPGRADIIVAGAAIIDTLMYDLGIQELRVSDRGLRDGLLIDYLSRHTDTAILQETSVRERSVLHLGRLCNFDEAHARHVARLALQLFDSAALAGLHRFGDEERELLEYSALIHDVGMFLSYSNHQEHSYYLIRNADLLGFDQRETAIMATAALFHRKAMPSKKKHPEFAALDRRGKQVVELFALLLRIAESLDRSHTDVVQEVKLHPIKKGEIALEIHGKGDCQLEIWGVQTHAEDFADVFGKKMVLETILEKDQL